MLAHLRASGSSRQQRGGDEAMDDRLQHGDSSQFDQGRVSQAAGTVTSCGIATISASSSTCVSMNGVAPRLTIAKSTLPTLETTASTEPTGGVTMPSTPLNT